jgi:hypothetical protein
LLHGGIGAAWNIWRVRNDFIFQEHAPYFGQWRVGFSSDLMLYQFEVKTALVQPLIDWLLHIFV